MAEGRGRGGFTAYKMLGSPISLNGLEDVMQGSRPLGGNEVHLGTCVG